MPPIRRRHLLFGLIAWPERFLACAAAIEIQEAPLLLIKGGP